MSVPVSSGLPAVNSLPPMGASDVATQRAANALHQRYGAAAASQISQLNAQSQAALSLPGQQKFQVSNAQDQDVKPVPQFQHQNHVQSQFQSRPQPQPQPQSQSQSSTVGNSQTDGAGDSLMDWKSEVARRRAAATKDGGTGDRILRAHLEAQAMEMEGGGLMAPLSERPGLVKDKKHKPTGPKPSVSFAPTLQSGPASTATIERAPAQYDGADSNDGVNDDDEDAINSDLDDPEDMLDDSNDDDEAVGQIMLCTYDKVQRVKSKWKCVLKDGILTTDGKEYVDIPFFLFFFFPPTIV